MQYLDRPFTLSISEHTQVLKKKFKQNYEQIQAQLMCSGLLSANLVFLSVETYDDEINFTRNINENEYSKFRISE